jgi:DNA-directed RNA polymerase specialized sigma54-like protein
MSLTTLEVEQTQSLTTRQEFKLIARLEQANLLEMPEEEFQRLIAEIEKSPLFERLYDKEKIIRCQRFPRTDISSHFYELNEEIATSEGSLDVESLLQSKEAVVDVIRDLGLEKFRRYFLFPEAGMTVDEIAEECDLDPSQVKRINDFIDDFSILSEFYHPSAVNSGEESHYSKIASVERGPEGFVIGYFSRSLARGKYVIDYQKFEQLKSDGFFSRTEVSEIRQLFKKLELVNSRKDTMYRILQNIVAKQSLYFESADSKALLPLSQKELAKRIGVTPSTISRVIWGKSLDTPWGEEKPIKEFFPRPKSFRKELLKQLIEAEKQPLSDQAITAKLEELGVSLSRRSVASLRSELKIAPARMRKRNGGQDEHRVHGAREM